MVNTITITPTKIRTKGNILNTRTRTQLNNTSYIATNTAYSLNSTIGRKYFTMTPNHQFKDIATADNHNSNGFSYNSTYIVTNYGDIGTIVSNTDTSESTRVYSAIKPNATYASWNSPITVEVDIVEVNGDNVRFQLYQDGNNSSTLILKNYGFTNGGHLKCTYDGTTVSYYKDNNSTPILTGERTLSNFQVRFSFIGTEWLEYKNFIIY